MVKKLLYKKIGNKTIRCLACHHNCVIPQNKTGICGVRKNTDGELDLLVYGKSPCYNIDPVEKKPLFHFLPGSYVFSFGTFGCNFGCLFCQNYDISQYSKENKENIKYWGEDLSPQQIIDFCLSNNIKVIAYTYNEPTIFVEYALDVMKLAKKNNIKNIFVSNGFMSDETIELIKNYLDAINIDLKSFSDDFYRKICFANIEPVKTNIKTFYDLHIWQEITTLIISGLNDSDVELKNIASFIYNISSDIPWHISAFYPAYKMIDRSSTSIDILQKAYTIGKKVGLKYIYIGNVSNNYEDTICPNCKNILVRRQGFFVKENSIVNNKCPKCQTLIAGIWN